MGEDEDVDNILDEEDEAVIKSMMMKVTDDGIEKKLNDDDDYDEGYNDEFINALVQQAQPPHVALADFEQMMQHKVGNEDEDVDNILDEEDEAVIKSMMMKVTDDGIEKKLNDDDDYDEGYNDD